MDSSPGDILNAEKTGDHGDKAEDDDASDEMVMTTTMMVEKTTTMEMNFFALMMTITMTLTMKDDNDDDDDDIDGDDSGCEDCHKGDGDTEETKKIMMMAMGDMNATTRFVSVR